MGTAVARGDLPEDEVFSALEEFDGAAALAPRNALVPWEAARLALSQDPMRHLRIEALRDRAMERLRNASEIEPNFAAPLELLRALLGFREDPEVKAIESKLDEIKTKLRDYAPENEYCRALLVEGRLP